MPAAARSRLCSRVSAWAGAFARIAMSSAKSASVTLVYKEIEASTKIPVFT